MKILNVDSFMCYITGHIYTVQENKKYLCESRIFDMDVEVIYNEMFYRYQLWYLKCIISQFPINTTRQL